MHPSQVHSHPADDALYFFSPPRPAEVAECFGSDITEHAVQHRFRVIRAHAEIVRLGRAAGQDPAFLPAEPMDNPRTIDKVDKRGARPPYLPFPCPPSPSCLSAIPPRSLSLSLYHPS